jgi:hypothetical protein
MKTDPKETFSAIVTIVCMVAIGVMLAWRG